MQWFYDLDIRKKLSLSYLAIGGAALLIAAVGFYGLHQVHSQNEAIYTDRLVPLMHLSAAEDALGAIQIRIEHLAQDQLVEGKEATGAANIDSLEQKITELEATFEDNFTRATQRDRTTEEVRQLVTNSERVWEALRGRTEKLLRQSRTGTLSVGQVGAFQKEARALNRALSELRAHQEEQAEAAEQESGAVYRASLIGLLVVSGIGIGLAVLLAIGGARLVSRPLRELEATAEELADGTLDARAEVETSDEIGSLAASFNDMAGQIEEALRETKQSRVRAKDAKEEAQALAERQKEEKQALAEHVDTLLDAMREFAEGDLTVRVDPDAEGDIGRLFRGFNEAVTTMGETIRQVREAVATAGATAEQVGASADQLAAGAEEQSSQAEEVAAAMEEMTRTIAENSEAVTDTSELARQNRQTARENGQVVLQAVNKMEEIGDAVGQSAEQVEQLHAASKEIGDIVSTIDEIADQTNLLALNAAIEAARAGEGSNGQVGQGFAVVAEEVRELAGRADEATDEIAEKIERIQAQTQQAVQAMETGQEEVDAGIELAEEARAAFEEIVEGTERIGERVDEIAAATEEQSSTSKQVSGSIESISTVSQQNARATHDIAEAISELREASSEARTRVEQFVVAGEAESKERPVRATASSRGDGESAPFGAAEEPVSLSAGDEV